MKLKGKKVLVISPAFFNYHNYIVREIESSGAYVKYISEPKENIIFKLARKLNGKTLSWIYNVYYSEKFKNISNYDIIFIIKGTGLSKQVINILKKNNKNARFIFYQWDSNENHNYLELINLFNTTFSFDRDDCKKFKLTHLPLFHIGEYRSLTEKEIISFKNDVLFIGSASIDRINLMKRLSHLFESNDISYNIKLYCSYWDYLKYTLKGLDRTFLTTKKISEDKILSLFEKSKSILDVPSYKQTGLSMRTFETLAANKILITTNQNIKNEKFFSPNNILILESDHISDFKNIINTPPTYIMEIDKYSISNWIKNIFEDYE